MLPTKNTVVELRSFARPAACAPCSAVAMGGAYHDEGYLSILIPVTSKHIRVVRPWSVREPATGLQSLAVYERPKTALIASRRCAGSSGALPRAAAASMRAF